MPIYDYRCDHCGHAFSAVRSYDDGDTGASCPSCGQRARKLMSRPAIVFKGSGWYKTDSRAAPAKDTKDTKDGAAKAGDPKPAEASAQPKSETAPAPAKDTGPKEAAS